MRRAWTPEEWALRCGQSQRRSDARRRRRLRVLPTWRELRADLGGFVGLVAFVGGTGAAIIVLSGPTP